MIDLRLGDCLEIMKSIADKSIDLVLTDPPYGTTACKWDTVIQFEPMWKELKRIRKDNAAICLFGSEPFSSHLRMSNIKEFKYDWIWKKSNPANFANAKIHPMKYHEIVSCFGTPKTNYFRQMIERKSERIQQANNSGYKFWKTQSGTMSAIGNKQADDYDPKLKNPSSIVEFNSLRPNSKEYSGHPTQKPVALLEYLIKTYTLENETVLDFTMGSGSTGVACKNLNRNFIGIEKDENYFEIAKNRIEGTK